jgi:hypothetical protein
MKVQKKDYQLAVQALLARFYAQEPKVKKKHTPKPLHTAEGKATFEEFYDKMTLRTGE